MITLQFKYRWVYVAVVVSVFVVVNFFYNVIPYKNKQIKLLTKQQALTEKINSEKKPVQSFILDKSIKNISAINLQIQFTESVNKLCRITDMHIKSINFLQNEEQDMSHIQIDGKGQICKAEAFLLAILNLPFPIFIDDFLYQFAKHELSLNLRVYNVKIRNHPFSIVESLCAKNHINRTKLSNFVNKFSLSELYVVGYLQHGSRVSAIIKLPNNILFEVKKSMLIGKEQALVNSITPNYVLLTLLNGQSFTLQTTIHT